MKLSLIQVFAESHDGKVSGTWLQDVNGTIEDAARKAKEIEASSLTKIQVAVVEEVGSSKYDLMFGIKRLA